MDDKIILFLGHNWQWLLLGYYIAEKVVKLTPTKYDDITIDIVWAGLKKLARKGDDSGAI